MCTRIMDVQTQLKQMLINQHAILTNQSMMLKEIASRYNPETNDATAEHCKKIIFRISQTENNIHATKTIIGEMG